jgi:hypothetical protein
MDIEVLESFKLHCIENSRCEKRPDLSPGFKDLCRLLQVDQCGLVAL